jgi:membrane protein implicated in regulation of membrane protease activity
MEPVKRWWLWLTAATTATVALWLLPAAAWAQSGPGVALVGNELARRPRGRSLAPVGACCCLVVVLAVVLVVMLVRRRRQPPPPPPPGA